MSDMGKSFVKAEECYSVGVHHCHNIKEGMGHSQAASSVGANRTFVNRCAMGQVDLLLWGPMVFPRGTSLAPTRPPVGPACPNGAQSSSDSIG